jgi:hypothetical protein
VIVANARKVRLIGESRKKDDRLDAQTLARLARIDPQFIQSKSKGPSAMAALKLACGISVEKLGGALFILSLPHIFQGIHSPNALSRLHSHV